jgi:hypothetical protein
MAAQAGPEIYSCEVIERATVSEAGLFEDATKGTVAGTAKGMKFIVVRDTGRPQGSTPVGSFKDQTARVLARGNDKNSFVAIYVGEAALGGVHFDALRVEEYVRQARKPFLAMAGGFVLSGTCE